MDKISSIRGMPDVFESDTNYLAELNEVLSKIFLSHNLNEVNTPILEQTELFVRSTGVTSDIVNKEIYSFNDRNEQSLSLRPEGTAGVVRSIIQKKLDNAEHKLWYQGPMFRYERPQKGRFRQFNQAGVELLGFEEGSSDLEIISIVCDIFIELELEDAVLRINHLGDKDTKEKFLSELLRYLKSYKGDLNENDREKLNKNPLRLLDSKDVDLKEFLDKGPKIIDFLLPEQLNLLDKIQSIFGKYVEIELDSSLVRGLDYYTGLVFEAVSSNLGAQDSFLGGGRYDDLSKDLGGKEMPAIGFAIGLERLNLIKKHKNIKSNKVISFVTTSSKMNALAFKIAQLLRSHNYDIRLETNFTDASLKAKLRKASKLGAKFVFIMGEEEFESDTITVKSFDEDGYQVNMSFDEILDCLLYTSPSPRD